MYFPQSVFAHPHWRHYLMFEGHSKPVDHLHFPVLSFAPAVHKQQSHSHDDYQKSCQMKVAR